MPGSARLLGRSRRLGAGLVTLLFVGCAGGGAQGPGPAARAGAAAAPAPGGGAGQFAPAQAAAPAYGAKVGRCPAAGAIREVMSDLEDAAKRAGRVPPTADPAVCAVAESFLRWDPAAGVPRLQILAFVSEWFGLPAPVLPPSIAVIETEDSRLIAERVVQAVGDRVLNALHPRLGFATQRVRRDATKVVVVLLDAPIEIAPPFPKRLELGQKATLSGRLLSGVTAPRVQVSDVTGQLSTPAQPGGDAFQAEVACGTRPGRIVVEVRGEVDGRAGVVANLPVRCGTDAPGAIAIAPEPWPTDPAEAEKKMHALINEERTAAGLRPLGWDAGVAGVARGIAQELAAKGSVAGDLGERLKREGIGSQLILQSAASERTFERVHERLLSNPSNRANIMNPEVTSVGIGAVAQPDADGKPMVHVAEVFTKEQPPLDVARTRRDLKAAVAQKRRDARMNALAVEPSLDDAAQRYAEALAAAGGQLPKEKHGELVAPLTRSMRTLSILSGAKPEPLDFAEEPQVTAVAKAFGVGVAQGKHPVLGRNAAYVVIMVGTTRADAEKPAVKEPGKAPRKPAAKPAR